MVEFDKSHENRKAFILYQEKPNATGREIWCRVGFVNPERREIHLILFTGEEILASFDQILHANIKPPDAEGGGA